eukprot:3138228-Amphidinium_carterae.1
MALTTMSYNVELARFGDKSLLDNDGLESNHPNLSSTVPAPNMFSALSGHFLSGCWRREFQKLSWKTLWL